MLQKITAPKNTQKGTYQRVLRSLQRLRKPMRRLDRGVYFNCFEVDKKGKKVTFWSDLPPSGKKKACFCAMGAAGIAEVVGNGTVDDVCTLNRDQVYSEAINSGGDGWDSTGKHNVINCNDGFKGGRKQRYHHVVDWLKEQLA